VEPGILILYKKLGAKESIPLASVSQTEGWNKYRRFWFNPEAF
jgi:hypothetical protein